MQYLIDQIQSRAAKEFFKTSAQTTGKIKALNHIKTYLSNYPEQNNFSNLSILSLIKSVAATHRHSGPQISAEPASLKEFNDYNNNLFTSLPYAALSQSEISGLANHSDEKIISDHLSEHSLETEEDKLIFIAKQLIDNMRFKRNTFSKASQNDDKIRLLESVIAKLVIDRKNPDDTKLNPDDCINLISRICAIKRIQGIGKFFSSANRPTDSSVELQSMLAAFGFKHKIEDAKPLEKTEITAVIEGEKYIFNATDYHPFSKK